MRTSFVASLLFIVVSQASAQGLTGTKTIGDGGDYATIVAAVAALNANGVGAGGVTFDILPGEYRGDVHFKPLAKAEPIVFRRAPTASGRVLVLGNKSKDAVWKIEGSYVTEMTLQGLTIVATDQTGVRLLSNTSSQVTLQDCEIRLGSSTSGTGVYFAYRCHSIQNTSVLRRNTIVVDSSNSWCHGIMTQGSVTLDGNRIQGTGNRTLSGLWLRDNQQTPMVLVNNLVVGFAQPLLVQDTGQAARAYHNTFLFTDSGFVVNVSNGSIEFLNNLCSAPRGICFSLQGSSTLISDSNLYWANFIGSVDGTRYETLENWRQSFGQDGHSLAANPKLTSADLTATPQVDSPCVNVGLAELASTDIDGQARPIGIAADIGAHEVMHAAPTDLESPGSTQFQARFVAPQASISARYRIQVSVDPDFATVIWDSAPSWSDSAPSAVNMVNVVGGEVSSPIPYAGPALQEETTYFWRIRFWDDTYQNPTRWSEVARFTTAAAPAPEETGASDPVIVETEPEVTPAPQPTVVWGDSEGSFAPESREEEPDPASAPGSSGGTCGLVGLDALLLLTLLSLRRRKSVLLR